MFEIGQRTNIHWTY